MPCLLAMHGCGMITEIFDAWLQNLRALPPEVPVSQYISTVPKGMAFTAAEQISDWLMSVSGTDHVTDLHVSTSSEGINAEHLKNLQLD